MSEIARKELERQVAQPELLPTKVSDFLRSEPAVNACAQNMQQDAQMLLFENGHEQANGSVNNGGYQEQNTTMEATLATQFVYQESNSQTGQQPLTVNYPEGFNFSLRIPDAKKSKEAQVRKTSEEWR